MPEEEYSGPERRRFRRLELRYPVHLESITRADAQPELVADGVTVNLSYGGALVGLSDATGLQGAMPVSLHFIDGDRVLPDAMLAVVWRLEHRGRDNEVAVEFDAPLMAYEGAVELADRLEWLRGMSGEEFVKELVEQFLDSVPDTLRRIRDRQHDGDLSGVAQLCRSLKSSAGDIGAVNLYEVSRRAEQAGGEGDSVTSGRYVEALQGYFDSIKGQLEEAC